MLKVKMEISEYESHPRQRLRKLDKLPCKFYGIIYEKLLQGCKVNR